MNQRQKFGKAERLDHKPPTLLLQPLFHLAVDESTGDHQNRKLRPYRLEVESELHAGPPRHIQIRNQQIDSRHARKDVRRPLRISRTEHAIAFMLKKRSGQRPHIRIVVHQKNRIWRRRWISTMPIERPQKIIRHNTSHIFRSGFNPTSCDHARETTHPTSVLLPQLLLQ
jgi:hypothetical protein